MCKDTYMGLKVTFLCDLEWYFRVIRSNNSIGFDMKFLCVQMWETSVEFQMTILRVNMNIVKNYNNRDKLRQAILKSGKIKIAENNSSLKNKANINIIISISKVKNAAMTCQKI